MRLNRSVGIALLAVMGLLAACGDTLEAGSSATTQPPEPTVNQLATLIAMQASATNAPTATMVTPTPLPPPATAAPTSTPAPTLVPTNTPRATQIMLAAITPTAAGTTLFDTSGGLRDHYWLARPFPRDPSNQVKDFASRNYAYGSTSGGQFQTHHGIDIQNTLGTPILAVASGEVVYAGTDSEFQFGPRLDFYGNLVVIQHDMPTREGAPFFTLYGHMFRIDVASGQRVEVGERIGSVGSTGVALGAHLHMEVRIGDPFDYGRTYNPDLWVRPWPTFGTLAGRITDRDGNRLYDQTIIIQPQAGPARSTYSYADDSVNPDPYYGEHFAYGDLPAGEYEILVRVRDVLRFKGTITIVAGQTNWIDIQVN